MVARDIVPLPHIFILSYPAHGHINPLLQLACRLAVSSSSLVVTIISADDAIDLIVKSEETLELPNLHFESFSSGTLAKDSSLDAYVACVRAESSLCISRLIKQHNPTCIIYDFGMPWVLEIASPLGILCASFFAQPATVYAIYYLHYHGEVSEQALLELGSLKFHDIPSPLQPTNKHPDLKRLLLDRFSNCSEPTLLLVNSFDELESKAVQFLFPKRALMTLGPLLPSAYFNKHNSQTRYTKSSGRVKECIQWLEGKEKGSVVYVSFGSILGLCDEQMEELAWGLKDSKRSFLWVVKIPNENIEGQGKNKLPDGFLEETSEQGLVVPWCPQLDVLSHPAIGCFVSHCGWNSTLESVCMGVPIVTVPQWMDQPTNAKFVADVWRVGVRARLDEGGLLKREELVRCLRTVMDDGGDQGGGSEARANACKWKDKARAAVAEGGSSWKNFEELLSHIHQHASAVEASSG